MPDHIVNMDGDWSLAKTNDQINFEEARGWQFTGSTVNDEKGVNRVTFDNLPDDSPDLNELKLVPGTPKAKPDPTDPPVLWSGEMLVEGGSKPVYAIRPAKATD